MKKKERFMGDFFVNVQVYCLVVDMDEPISHAPQPTPVQETALPW